MDWEEIRKEYEAGGITLQALADKHDIKIGTLKSRKSREGWGGKKDATKRGKVASTKNKDATKKKQKNRSGNPNPNNQFAKRNTAARKHGLRSKYFSASQKEIMEDFEEFSIADQLWIQIEIKFSAIIQLQKVMWVEYADQTLNEESMVSSGEGGDSTAYKVVYAFEQYESYIKAQARAMAEYRNLVKHFVDMAHDEDERKLKLEQMQTSIDKNRAVISKLDSDGEGSQESEVAKMLRKMAGVKDE
ncbi:hypothetical protein [Jeotgalibacillus haloalkalitolerans]|uniref:Terminase n=1 Tax=Jeotgalibacillus haloalkalitolerans TaxID=3104292 RepID=A0ABU5KLM3_9BACL|nr:hypothetical protein [Jeotgalibacillus sp. HH7-29]MDZ5711646.1 hypothetical protein [Jeotgalibacillus sp. HH7-29]